MSPVRRKGPWSEREIEAFLDQACIPLRLACNGASGHPVLASLWFVAREGRLWCATQQSAAVAEHLRRDPRCAFEVAVETPPYHGVRGQARVHFDDTQGEPLLRELIDRYLGDADSELARWLLARADDETAIAIEPRSVLSWDYRDRMGEAA
jgi:hypothetical protein